MNEQNWLTDIGATVTVEQAALGLLEAQSDVAYRITSEGLKAIKR